MDQASHPTGAAVTILINYGISLIAPHIAALPPPPVEVINAEQMMIGIALAWLFQKANLPTPQVTP